MIPVLLSSHYAYADTAINSNAKKLHNIIRDLDSKVSTFDSMPRAQKSDTIAAIKQHKDDVAEMKKQFQTLKAVKGDKDFLSVTTFKKALREVDRAADNAYCLVINKYLNEKAYTVCMEKFTVNKNKAYRLTTKLD
jgi:hypothetical protein